MAGAHPVQLKELPSTTDTLPKTNIAAENRPSQKETSLPTIHVQVRAVSFRDANSNHVDIKWSL